MLTRLIEFDSIYIGRLVFPGARGHDITFGICTYRVLASIVDGHRDGGHKLVNIRVHRLVPGLWGNREYITYISEFLKIGENILQTT